MTLRLPQNFSGRSASSAVDIMAAEIRVEKAISLERSGEAAVKTVAALKAAAASDPQRPRLLAEAAEAVWSYFIQRELMGQASHAAVIRDIGIPPEVIARLGARPKAE